MPVNPTVAIQADAGAVPSGASIALFEQDLKTMDIDTIYDTDSRSPIAMRAFSELM